MRLPLYLDCTECPAFPLCGVSGTAEACWDSAAYEEESLHPQAVAAGGATFDLVPPVSWGRIATKACTLPLYSDLRAPPLEHGLALPGSLRYVREGRSEEPPLALFTYGSDQKVERIWADRGRLEWPDDVPVVATAFSTWIGRPPFEHAIETVRTAELATVLSRKVPVIPSIPLSRFIMPAWWYEFLSPGNPADIAIDLATKVHSDWSLKMTTLRRLASALRPLRARLVAYGVSEINRVHDVLAAWDGNTLFCSRSVIDAALIGGRRLDEDDLSRTVDYSFGRGELALENAAAYELAVMRTVRRDLGQKRFGPRPPIEGLA